MANLSQLNIDFSQIRLIPKEKTQSDGPMIAFRISEIEAQIIDVLAEASGAKSRNEWAHEAIIKAAGDGFAKLHLLKMHAGDKLGELLSKR